MGDEDNSERKSSVTMRVGLTLPTSVVHRFKRLYLASSQILFPYEISYTDFVNLLLRASSYEIFPDLPKDAGEETIFYPARFSSDLKDELLDSFKQSDRKTWKDPLPIDYNQFLKNQFLKCTTDGGAISMMSFIFYCKVVLDLLEKQGINDEGILSKGKFPEIPKFHELLSRLISAFVTPEATVVSLKKLKGRRLNQALASAINQLQIDLSTEMAKVLSKAREDSKITYTDKEVFEILSEDRKVIDSFPLLMDITNNVYGILVDLAKSDQVSLDKWKQITIKDRIVVVETIEKITSQLK